MYPDGMGRKVLRVGIVALVMLFNSCAYVQTHKNVEEMGSYYTGHVLDGQNMELVKSEGRWYIGAQAARFHLRYPIVHDSIFREKKGYPFFKQTKWSGEMEYHPITSYVADVLQTPNGFFDMEGLAQEIAKVPGPWKKSLRNKQSYSIRAELSEKNFQMEESRIPQKKQPLNFLLGKLDFIVVDVPGTLLYNAAIPLMAPFVFFYEFNQNN